MRIQYRNNYKYTNAPYSYNSKGSRKDYHRWYYWNVIKKDTDYWKMSFTRKYEDIILTFD
jgi:hypothetical protein